MLESLSKPAAGRKVFQLITLVLLANVCVLFFRSWIQRTLIDDGVGDIVANNVSFALVTVLFVVLLYPVWAEEKRDTLYSLRCSALTWKLVLIGVTLGIVLRLAYWGGLIAIGGLGLHVPPSATGELFIAFDCPAPEIIVLHLLVASALVPITEEIFFRAWIFRWLLPYGVFIATLISTLLFASMHTTSGMLTAFVFSFYAARLYFNTGTIWGPVIAHVVYNGLIAIDWYCLRVIWLPDSIDNIMRAVGALGMSLMFVSLTLGAFLVSRRVTGPLAR